MIIKTWENSWNQGMNGEDCVKVIKQAKLINCALFLVSHLTWSSFNDDRHEMWYQVRSLEVAFVQSFFTPINQREVRWTKKNREFNWIFAVWSWLIHLAGETTREIGWKVIQKRDPEAIHHRKQRKLITGCWSWSCYFGAKGGRWNICLKVVISRHEAGCFGAIETSKPEIENYFKKWDSNLARS